jgi:hypothetical protein
VGTAGDALVQPARESAAPTALPWAVAGIALLALVALVAGQHFNGRSTPTGEPGAGLAGAGSAGGAGGAVQTGQLGDAGTSSTPPRAPDISALSPRERADRLYDRIMRLDSEGKKDSVEFFAQMAISAYQMLPEQDLDSRYDMGRIAEVAGATPLARAQADSILAAYPDHLLGLILAISNARDAGDQATVRTLERRLLAVQRAELAKNRPEYQRHQNEIVAAIEQAQNGAK